MQASTRVVRSLRPSHTGRGVASASGVYKTVLVFARAAYTLWSEGSRGPYVARTGSVVSQRMAAAHGAARRLDVFEADGLSGVVGIDGSADRLALAETLIWATSRGS